MKTIFKATALVFSTYLFTAFTANASNGDLPIKEQKNIKVVFPAPQTTRVIFIKKCNNRTIIKVVKVHQHTTSLSSTLLESEMNKMQESMTEMDAELLKADEQSRKAGENILATGIHG